MRQRSRFAVAAASLLLAVGATACTPDLDTGGLEASLKDMVSEDTGATITTVDCPDVKAETGGTFTCTATDDAGSTFVLKVTQKDDQGNVVYDYVDASVSPTPSP